MRIGTIYTLYGRRAGAELCFEKTVESISSIDSTVEWVVFCNKEAERILLESYSYVKPIYVSWLDNQYKKAFWLEFLSKSVVESHHLDCFWNPSGCNHFPGKWVVPVLTTFHDLGEYHVKNKYSFARMFFRKRICIPRSVQRSSSFTCVSKFTFDDMERFLNISQTRKRVSVIYNGHSPHSITFPNDAQDMVKRLGLECGMYFFTPGRTDFIGKGLDVLLNSFENILKERQNVKLVLVGPKGEGHERLEKEIGRPVFENRVLYLGRVDEDVLVSLYSNCIATIIASRFEGFGFPVLEAMEYGVPIVCSSAAALPEIAGDAALMFKSEDIVDLEDKLKKVLMLDLENRTNLVKRGKNRLALFSWDKCAREMIDAFNEVLML